MLVDKKWEVSNCETLAKRAIDTSLRTYAVFKDLRSGVDDLTTTPTILLIYLYVKHHIIFFTLVRGGDRPSKTAHN